MISAVHQHDAQVNILKVRGLFVNGYFFEFRKSASDRLRVEGGGIAAVSSRAPRLRPGAPARRAASSVSPSRSLRPRALLPLPIDLAGSLRLRLRLAGAGDGAVGVDEERLDDLVMLACEGGPSLHP